MVHYRRMNTDYERIEKVITYLENNWIDQPSLEDLSALLNLSPFHFQRLFTRWAGISPKQFLQFLTLDYAKDRLQENSSVLDAAYESGMSSPSRLHNTFVVIEGITPGEYKSKGEGLEILYGMHDSPFGKCFIGLTNRGVCRLSFISDADLEAELVFLGEKWPKAIIKKNLPATGQTVDAIFARCAELATKPLKILLKGSNFQIKVWDALLRIPAGCLTTYGNIAKVLGMSGAARAVGGAVGANPVAYLVPCHRVIRKLGAFGGYAYGPARKKAIIGWEMAQEAKRRGRTSTVY